LYSRPDEDTGVLALLTTTAADEAGRNRALAGSSAVGIGGGALGLLLGGALTQYSPWRWTLLVNVPLGLGVLLAVPHLISETPRQRERFDLAGAALTAAASVSVVWALIGAPDGGWGSSRTLGGLALGALLLAALVVTERRTGVPLLLNDRGRVGALIVTTAVFAANSRCSSSAFSTSSGSWGSPRWPPERRSCR